MKANQSHEVEMLAYQLMDCKYNPSNSPASIENEKIKDSVAYDISDKRTGCMYPEELKLFSGIVKVQMES